MWSTSRYRPFSVNYWPSFLDVVTAALMVFVLSTYFQIALKLEITPGDDEALKVRHQQDRFLAGLHHEFKSDIELPEMWQAKERCAARKERKALGIADQTTEIPTEKGCPETPVSTWMVRTRSPRNRKQLASLRGDGS